VVSNFGLDWHRAREQAKCPLAARGRSAQTARNLLINRLESTQIIQQQVFCHGLLASLGSDLWMLCVVIRGGFHSD